MDKSPNEPIRLPRPPEVIPTSDPRVTEATKQIEAYQQQAITPPIVRPQLIETACS